MAGFKLKVTPEMEALTEICVANSKIDSSLYTKYDVKRGLRDINGKGVLAGLTEISAIISSETVDGKSVPCDVLPGIQYSRPDPWISERKPVWI